MIRTVTYDDSTHVLLPIIPTDAMAVAAIKVSLGNPAINGLPQWKAMIAAAPEYQEPDIRAKLAANMVKYLGATKTQAKAIIDGVFDGEHTINELDLKYQEPVKTMICKRCGADRFKEHCKQPDFGCPIGATALDSTEYQEPTKDE